jgi:uncharacterized integral membrane protein
MYNRVVMIIVVLLFTVFVLQNTQVVEVRFLFWQTQASRALVLIITFVGGLITGWLSRYRRKNPVVQNKETLKSFEDTGKS